LNADKKMIIEIAEKLAKGNKAYHAIAKLIKSNFIYFFDRVSFCITITTTCNQPTATTARNSHQKLVV
jgi:hypothetical protein